MTIDRRVIQKIRLQRAQDAGASAVQAGTAAAATLLQVSGVLERGIDPSRLNLSPADLPRLLELARAIEAEEAMLEPHEASRHTTRRAV